MWFPAGRTPLLGEAGLGAGALKPAASISSSHSASLKAGLCRRRPICCDDISGLGLSAGLRGCRGVVGLGP